MYIPIYDKDKYNIIVIGAGGTGSHFISFLTQLVGNSLNKNNTIITIIDDDLVEEKNITNQKFCIADLSKNKAEVLAERYSSIYNINIRYIDKRIESKEELIALKINESSACNIFISCVDNIKTRLIINEAYKHWEDEQKYKVMAPMNIYIDSGNSAGADDLTGQIAVCCSYRGADITPNLLGYFPNLIELEKENTREISCGEAPIQNIGANITSATILFNVFNNIYSHNKIIGNIYTFNASTMEMNKIIV